MSLLRLATLLLIVCSARGEIVSKRDISLHRTMQAIAESEEGDLFMKSDNNMIVILLLVAMACLLASCAMVICACARYNAQPDEYSRRYWGRPLPSARPLAPVTQTNDNIDPQIRRRLPKTINVPPGYVGEVYPPSIIPSIDETHSETRSIYPESTNSREFDDEITSVQDDPPRSRRQIRHEFRQPHQHERQKSIPKAIQMVEEQDDIEMQITPPHQISFRNRQAAAVNDDDESQDSSLLDSLESSSSDSSSLDSGSASFVTPRTSMSKSTHLSRMGRET